MKSDYMQYVQAKQKRLDSFGFEVDRSNLPKMMFPWQADVAAWNIRKGRAANFINTGHGKTIIQLSCLREFRRKTGKPSLLLAPLSVGPQTCREAVKFNFSGVQMYDGTAEDVPPIAVCNYQKLHKLDLSKFGAVGLDESDILKSMDGKTKQSLCINFADYNYRLAFTATPAPNDIEEFGNHAEFLGVCSRVEMLATYFVHDSGDTSKWRLKGHAENAFWDWLGSWAMVLRKPSDLGYEGMDFDLPPLNIHTHEVDAEAQEGRLFATAEITLSGQRTARKKTYSQRIAKAAELTKSNDGQWLIWCETNKEQDELEKLLGDSCISIQGSDKDEWKIAGEEKWRTGKVKTLLSKPSIFGHGLNWQHCQNMVFVSLSHSFAAYYQAVRRCWRYGQMLPVNVHVITSALESAIYDNVIRKQGDHEFMFDAMIGRTSLVNRSEIKGVTKLEEEYNPRLRMKLPKWANQGDK